MISAAGAIIFLVPEGSPGWRVLLVRRGRAPGAGTFSLPGGRVEPGESPAEAARREVAEETGLDVRVLEETEVVELQSEGFSYRIHEHLCELAGTATLPVAGDDAVEARWVPAEELETLEVSPESRAVILRAAALASAGRASRSVIERAR